MPDTEAVASVVIVDDDPQITALCRVHLERTGSFRIVATGETAAEGFDLALTNEPRVVLVDLGLPDGSGETLIGDLFRALPGSMVAAFTGMDAEQAESRVIATGAFAYYEKDMLEAGQLSEYLRQDLQLFARAVEGEDVIAPSAIQRRAAR
jgi:DNA-binding NarL/FixJ family response regulator